MTRRQAPLWTQTPTCAPPAAAGSPVILIAIAITATREGLGCTEQGELQPDRAKKKGCYAKHRKNWFYGAHFDCLILV